MGLFFRAGKREYLHLERHPSSNRASPNRVFYKKSKILDLTIGGPARYRLQVL